MILVQSITIEEFRGIRKHTFTFSGHNFAICGPNGTGKSGVVDALEFGLTGNISRLSGSGTGGVTLKKHAPHVDSRDYPEKAKVTLVLTVPELNGLEVTLTRSVKDSSTPTISPSTPEVLDVLSQLDNHPEFVLSRRELIAYVLAQPGKRSEEIQALLRLDEVGNVRSSFLKIKNSAKKEADTLKQAALRSRASLVQGLDISEFSKEKLLKAVNERREVLGLEKIEELGPTTTLDDGLKSSSKTALKTTTNKAEIAGDMQLFNERKSVLEATENKTLYNEIYDEVEALSADPLASESVERESFLRKAVELITEEAQCPVCDTEWEFQELQDKIATKLQRFEKATKTRKELEAKLKPVINLVEDLESSISQLEKHSRILAKEHTIDVTTYKNLLKSNINALKNFLPFEDTLQVLDSITQLPEKVVEAVTVIDDVLKSMPDPSKQIAARDYLILCNERLKAYREAARDSKRADEHAELSLNVYNIYEQKSSEVLEGVYKLVEDEFGEFYRFINSDDEGDFTAKLKPSIGKLGFEVEFYNRGHFPPGAYHSEGHQDGMGLCLYLALMQRLQGEKFTFAVLDDVLMSVDTGHRREVCELLKQKFPNTQFILTTHDDVWLKHMISVGLITANDSVRFSNWTPDTGPTEWSKRDVWTEIETALEKDDVREAASLLRFYLEYMFKEISNYLKARVEYRGDGRYDLGDVLGPAVKKYKELLKEAKTAAESWGKSDVSEEIKAKINSVTGSFNQTNAEQWQINPAIHYNDWANLKPKDFRPVAQAYKALLNEFICTEQGCGGLLYTTTSSYKVVDSLRCACGHTNISLKKK